MFQIKLNTEDTDIATTTYIYLNLYNEIDIRFASGLYPEGDFYKPLQQLKCQQTGKSIYYLGLTVKTNLERYVGVTVSANITGSNVPVGGLISLSPPDFLIGIYDYTIYENTSSTNLDPTGLKVIYNGLANVTPVNDSGVFNPSPEYTEFTTNDDDTNSVYITFD